MKTIYIVLFLMLICISILRFRLNQENYNNKNAANREGDSEKLVGLLHKILGILSEIDSLSQEERQEYARKILHLSKNKMELNRLKDLRLVVDTMKIDNKSEKYIGKLLDKFIDSHSS